MDEELIERLAKDAGMKYMLTQPGGWSWIGGPGNLSQFAALVAEECAKAAIPPGFRLLPIEPTMEMYEAAGEELYGHSREKAVEWAKEDKFESCAQTGMEAWRVMVKASPANTPIPTKPQLVN